MTTTTTNPRHERIRQGIRVAVAINLRRSLGADSILMSTDEVTSCPHFIVSRSAREPGRWQLTWLDHAMAPVGHQAFESLGRAVCSASGKSIGRDLPHGDHHYRVVKTAHVVNGFTVETRTHGD